ncbi:hypothetical protein [Streptomyces sp. NPDC127119]|uniref:effector-associated constant component EACC1 n=1 Tax=Streptomyces sp. NPDC127119 TaxID=3345370 RepID=UPI00362C0531
MLSAAGATSTGQRGPHHLGGHQLDDLPPHPADAPGPTDRHAAGYEVRSGVLTNFQVLNLGLAYTAWRASRGRPTPVTVERNGVTIVLDDAEPETVARLVRELDR